MKYVLATLFVVMGVTSTRAQQIKTKVEITSTLSDVVKQQAASSIESALMAFQVAYAEGNRPALSAAHFSSRGQEAVWELWSRAPFRCIYTLLDGPLVRRSADDLFEFRGVTLHLEDASGAPFREEGLFIIDNQGRIVDFKFGLDVQTYTQILEERRDLTELRHRQFILDFVDNFRTSFNRKDLTFLERVFSDNALIIVGRVLQVSNRGRTGDHVLRELGTQRVEFIKHSKQEYLSRLDKVFMRNEFIKVEFNGINVYPHAEIEGIYGVELLQHWHSFSTRQEGYKDEGYLFLMVDLRDVDQPLIHVRTWQPKSETLNNEVINLSNFRIIG